MDWMLVCVSSGIAVSQVSQVRSSQPKGKMLLLYKDEGGGVSLLFEKKNRLAGLHFQLDQLQGIHEPLGLESHSFLF